MCLPSAKHLDGTDERSQLPLLEKYSDVSSKIPDSALHRSSSCREQEERAAPAPLDWNTPNSTRADAIHRGESKHLFFSFRSRHKIALLCNFQLLEIVLQIISVYRIFSISFAILLFFNFLFLMYLHKTARFKLYDNCNR